jgi:hypothetical protein
MLTASDLAHALGARRTGSRWMARCPAHQDPHPSLSIREQGGHILVHCFTGCRQEAVIDALRALGLWPRWERKDGHPRPPRDPDRWADLERAEYWRMAARILTDQLLEELPLEDPARRALTSLACTFRDPSPDVLLVCYRDWRANDAPLTAGLVRSGRLLNARLQRFLAEFIVSEDFAR